MLTFLRRALLSHSHLRSPVARGWRRRASNHMIQSTHITDNAEVQQNHVHATLDITSGYAQHQGSRLSEVNPDDQRSLKAAIIGVPNVGKSTLSNQILGQKVFAVSPRRHTTIHRAMGVYTEGNSQVVLLDTPGLIPYKEGRKLRVTKQFLTDPSRSLMEADLVVVMVDVSNKRTRVRLDPTIVKILRENCHIPSVLVLNKIDLLSHKHVLLAITEGLTGTMERKEKQTQIAALTRKLRNPYLPEKVRAKFLSIIEQLESEIETATRTNTTSRELSPNRMKYSNRNLNREPLYVSPECINSTPANPDSRSSPNFQAPTYDQMQTSAGSLREEVQEVCNESSLSGEPFVNYRHTHSWPHFKETFMISSLTGDGVESLKSYLLSCATPCEWQYSPHEVTDQPSLSLVEDIVREKLFLFLQKEIPYVVTQDNVLWEVNEDNVLVIYQNLNCKSHSQASIVIGPMGRTIQEITAEATKDIEGILNCKIELTLNVKSNKR